jgi:hypothetical protein
VGVEPKMGKEGEEERRKARTLRRQAASAGAGCFRPD